MPRLARIGSAASGSFGFASGSRLAFISANYVVIGGGGLDGSNYAYGGGAGGRVLPVTAVLSTLTSYPAVGGSATASSSFNGTTATAGGSGGSGTLTGSPQGGNGGSNSAYSGGSEATYYIGDYVSPAAGGGGAGAGQNGGNGSVNPGTDPATPQGGNGGNGIQWAITGVYYGGGGGGWWQGGPTGDYNGSAGLGATNYGGGATRGNAQPGAVIVSYVNLTQLFTGGTVTSTGTGITTRWFHTITGTVTLTPIP